MIRAHRVAVERADAAPASKLLGGNSHDGYGTRRSRPRGAAEQVRSGVYRRRASSGTDPGSTRPPAAGAGDAGEGGAAATAAGPGDTGQGGATAAAAATGSTLTAGPDARPTDANGIDACDRRPQDRPTNGRHPTRWPSEA